MELNPALEEKVERQSTWEKICLAVIKIGACLALFTPLIVSGKFFFPFVGPKSLYFMGLVEIIFFAYLFLAFSCPKYRPKFNILSAGLILFTVVMILSSVLGADPSYSFWSKYERMTGLLMWFHLLAFFTVISSVFKKQDWYKVFAVSLFAAVFISLMNLLRTAGVDIGGNEGATLGNSSFLATYLLFNAFFAFYLFSQKKFKIYSGITFILIVLSLLFSGGRAAILTFYGGAILLLLLWLIFCRRGRLKLAGIVLSVIFALGILGAVFLVLQPDSSIQQQFIEKLSKDRLIAWQIAWQGFEEKPLLGWGPENFDLVFTKHFNSCLFLPQCGGETWFDRAHNIVFDTLVALGIIGLLSYLGIFLSIFYSLWKKYFKDKLDFWTAGVFSVLLIAYFIQNFTVFDMVSSYMLLFLVLGFIGFLLTPEKEQARSRSPHPLLVVGLAILFLISFVKFVVQPALTDHYVIRALSSPTTAGKLDFSEKALNASPVGRYQIREMLANNTIKRIENRAQNKMPDEDIEKELIFMAEEMEKSTRESPLNYRSWLKLGEFYNFYAKFDPAKLIEAERVLNKAIELSPNNQQGYWYLAQTKAYQSEFSAALSSGEKALQLDERVVRSHQIVIQTTQMMGDHDLAKEKAKTAIPFAEDMVRLRPSANSYLDLVRIAQIAQEYDLMEEKAKEAVKLNPDWQPYFEKFIKE